MLRAELDLMIITCPVCATRYSVDSHTLPPGGRMVRCGNCRNQWPQSQVAAAVAPPQPQAPLPQSAQPATALWKYPPSGHLPSPAMQYPAEYPQHAAYGAALSYPTGIPIHLQQSSYSRVESEPEPEPEPEPELEKDSKYPSEPESEELSPEQLENIFGKDAPHDPAGSLADSEDGGNDENNEDDEDEDIDDTDDPLGSSPIPEALTSPSPMPDSHLARSKKESPTTKIVLFLAIFSIAGILIGAVVARDYVAAYLPFTKGIYETVGKITGFGEGEKEIGKGLKLNISRSERALEAGVDVLIIHGEVINSTEQRRALPKIKIWLTDADGKVTQSALKIPEHKEVPAGKKVLFTVRIPKPSAAARRIEADFVAE